MKRNLSSQAIKAMAVGMAVMLGSTAAISGVVKGSVVEAKASTPVSIQIENPDTLVSLVKQDSYVVTPDGVLFKVNQEGTTTEGTHSDGTVTLIGTVGSDFTGNASRNGENVPFMGVVEENRVVLKSKNGKDIFKFEIEQIGDGTNPLAVATISDSSAPDFSNYSNPATINASLISDGALIIDENGLTIKKNAFKGVTLINDLTLSDKINIEEGGFAGINAGNSTIDLSKALTGTIHSKAFSDETGAVKTTYGTLRMPTFKIEANSFNNVDVTTLLEFTAQILTLDKASTFNPGAGGNTIKELKLSSGFASGIDGLFAVNGSGKYTIETLNTEDFFTEYVPEGTFNNTNITTLIHNGVTKMRGSIIDNLKFGSNVTKIEEGAFKGATIKNDITIPKEITSIGASAFEGATIKSPGTITMDGVKTIGDKAFEIASPSKDVAINVSLKGYENTNLDNIAKDAFGSQNDTAQKYNIELKVGTSDEHRKALEDKLKDATNSKGNANVTVSVAVAPTVKSAVINNNNADKIVLTFSENIKAANEPATTDFTVTVDGKPNEVKELSKITSSATGNTLTLTLTTPVNKGQQVKVSYNKTNNAITNNAGTELANFVDTVVTNNIGKQQGTNGSTKPEKSANKYIEVPLGDTSYGMFEITEDDGTADGNTTDAGTVKLVEVSKTSQITESGELDGTDKTKAYKGVIGGTANDLVKVTYNNDSAHVTFKMTEVVANSATSGVTVSGQEFSKLAKNLTTVSDNSFKNYTFEGDLDLSTATGLANLNKSLAGATINGELKLKNDVILVADGFNGSNISTLTFTGNVTLVENGFNGATIGTLNLDSGYKGVANAFKGATITTLELPSGYTGVAKDFEGATKIENLDLSKVDNALASSTFKGSTIGTLKLHANNTFAKEAFSGVTIASVEHNGKALMNSDSDGANIQALTFGENVTTIDANVFENATIPAKLTLPKVNSIGANAFKIKEPANVTIDLPSYTDADISKIDATAFGDASGKNFTINMSQGVTDTTLTSKLENKNVKVHVDAPIVAPTVQTAVVENSTPNQIVLTFSENIKAAAGEPTATDFTVKVNGQANVVTKLSEISTSAKGNTLTLTLTTPVAHGQEVKVSYSKTGNAITNDAGTELANFADKVVTNNVEQQQGSTVEVTNDNNKYTFKITSTEGTKTVALSDFEKVDSKRRARRDVSRAVTFNDGKVNVGGVDYTLTKIGTGTPLKTIDDAALQGHTDAVTEIAEKAFEGNKVITNVDFKAVTKVGNNAFANTEKVTTVNLPKVESVGNGAFANSKVKTVDLGSGVDKNTAVNIPSDAFKGASNVTSIKTNENSSSKNNAVSAAKDSGSNKVTVESGNSSTEVKPEVKPDGGSGGGSGSSSSSDSSGSGANIGTTVDNSNANNNQNQNNNNNTTTTVVEDKQLSLDAISLPSVTGEAKSFGDISANHWAKSYIDKLSTAGIINGINGNFQPNGQTKRADVTIMLVKLLGLTPQSNNKFADVNANAYYAPYVGAASTYGIVNGSNGMFNPEGIISRQDTMVMIGQILKSLNLNVNTDATSLSKFSDLSKVAPYAQESVAILVNSGIITGNNGKLNPTAPVTRAEMATIMSKLYDVLAAANK